MMQPRAVLALTFGLLAGCCGDDVDPESLEPPLELPELYRLWRSSPEEHVLSRRVSHTEIELRGYASGSGEYLGRIQGQLDPATSEELDALLDALVHGDQPIGELPGTPAQDAIFVDLSLPGEYQITYTYANPPSGLIEIDTLLRTVYRDLLNCRAGDRVTPSPDCEIFTAYPD